MLLLCPGDHSFKPADGDDTVSAGHHPVSDVGLALGLALAFILRKKLLVFYGHKEPEHTVELAEIISASEIEQRYSGGELVFAVQEALLLRAHG